MDNIEDFINSPYQKIDESIIEHYSFEEWLKRFNIGGYSESKIEL